MSAKPDLPVVPFASREAWAAWLEERHKKSDGLWLKIAKKGSGIETVTFPEALDMALCYGWIDGQRARFDERFFLQRFTPRKPRSKWSRVNREKVTKLIETGEMKPSGLREVERAKADGRWEAAYEPQSTATAPTICSKSSGSTARLGSSSPHSTAETVMQSCTRYRTPRGQRRGHDASRSTWLCLPSGRNYIPKVIVPTGEVRGTPSFHPLGWLDRLAS
jgi:hypothetical protein